MVFSCIKRITKSCSFKLKVDSELGEFFMLRKNQERKKKNNNNNQKSQRQQQQQQQPQPQQYKTTTIKQKPTKQTTKTITIWTFPLTEFHLPVIFHIRKHRNKENRCYGKIRQQFKDDQGTERTERFQKVL